ncbi:MAG: hypothetical protein U0174_05650 [Polyangiaceae bacterium]
MRESKAEGGAAASRRYVIEGAVRTAYLALRAAQTGRPQRATVLTFDADRVADVEEALGRTFDGPALLLFGEGGFSFTELVRFQASGRTAKVPHDLVALACEDHTWTCLRLGSGEPAIVLYLDEDQSTTVMTLAQWFDRQREEVTEGVLKPATQLEDATLEIVVSRASAARATSYRVRHPKFGEGVVLSEEGTGDALKLEVDFADGGKKKLLGRFVTRID